MYIDKIQLKKYSSDFLVSERISYEIKNTSNGFPLYKLYKKGISTFDAITEISNFLSIDSDNFKYAGLKDEDGITEQFITSKFDINNALIEDFNNKMSSNDKFLNLTLQGNIDNELGVGDLEGNNFIIKVRNIHKELVQYLDSLVNEFYFYNYYDTQRFGLPNLPKVTHKIGQSILDKDYDCALDYVIESESKESINAKNYIGNAKCFFKQLDKRIFKFYLNSHSSYIWNKNLNNYLNNNVEKKDILKIKKDGFVFNIANSDIISRKIQTELHMLPFQRYIIDKDLSIETTVANRKVILDTQIKVNHLSIENEELKTYVAEFEFFLSKGVYATNVITQFFQIMNDAE